MLLDRSSRSRVKGRESSKQGLHIHGSLIVRIKFDFPLILTTDVERIRQKRKETFDTEDNQNV